jgi:hypothetical protein
MAGYSLWLDRCFFLARSLLVINGMLKQIPQAYANIAIAGRLRQDEAMLRTLSEECRDHNTHDA